MPGASKKLSSCVRPGVLEVRASPRRLTRALIRLDLPTLERPAKAISCRSAAGRNCSSGTLLTNCHGRLNSASPAASSSGVKSVILPLPILSQNGEREPVPHPLRAFLAAQDVARRVDPGRDGVVGAVEPAFLPL